MKLAIIGTGYVGLVAGVCFAEAGNDVICVDVDPDKLARLQNGQLTIYEPGLDRLFSRNQQEDRLIFTDNLDDAMREAEIVFLALPTPPGEDGSADLSYILGAAEEIGKRLTDYKVIVTKSTVPVGTADAVREQIQKHTQSTFDVVSNPEFLREGAAVDDFMRPERVIVGVDPEAGDAHRAESTLKELYRPFLLSGNPLLVMDTRSAELAKYAANAMLAMRISFMNDIARLCEQCGANVDRVRLGLGLDSRIGRRFLFPGIGWGGSCFRGDETVFVAVNGVLQTRLLEELWQQGGTEHQDKNVDWKAPQHWETLAYDLESGQPVMARIEAMTRRAYRGPLVTLTLDMGRTLSVTADHPVILHAARGETIVAAHQVKAGDKILAMSQLPIMPPLQPLDLIERLRHTPLADDVHVTCTQGSFTRLYEQFASHIARQDLRYPHEIKRHNRMPLRLFWKLEALGVLTISHQTLQLYTAGGNGARLNAVIAQDADFWRFCGYYLAEGYISQDQGRFNSIRQRIGLCFHQNEHEYIEDVRRIVEKWGLKWISRTSTNATTTIVSSRIFAWLLRDVLGCGVRSEDKRLPAGTFAAPPELRRELVRGLFSGDGAVTALQNGRNLMFEYATVSKPLSDGVALLLQTLEVVPSIRTRWMNKSKRPAYIVRVNGYQQMRLLQNTFGARHHNRIGQVLDGYQRHIRQRGFERLDNTVVLTVRGVQQESVDTTVFSMETATGTLVASSGLICHNCFPKDVRALISTGQQYGAPQRLLEATYQINEEQKQVLLPRILEHFGGDVSGKTFALWGLSFKPNTDDIREAPALILIEELVSRGAHIRAYDPEAMEPAKKLVGDKVEFARRHYDACEGADALIIATEWNKFREPDFHFLKELLRQPVIFDGRNIYELDTVGNHGFTYYSIGRPIVHAA